MANKEKLDEEDVQILEPIIYDKRLSSFKLRNEIDLFDSILVIKGCDKVIYALSSRLPTKAYGDIYVKFMYIGVAYMQVKTEKKTFVYKFNSDIFETHIINFIRKHISTWKEHRVFGGTEEMVSFYNAVLTAHDTVEAPEARSLFGVK